MVSFLEFASNISHSTSDALVFIIFLFLFLASVFIFSYRRIIDNVISIYVTSALIEGVPYSRRLMSQINQSGDPTYFAKMLLLGILVVGIFILVSWGVSERGERHGATQWLTDWWKIFPLAFAQTGLFFSITLGYLDPLWSSAISWSSRKVFIGEIAKIVWFLMPIAFMILASKLSSSGGGQGAKKGGQH